MNLARWMALWLILVPLLGQAALPPRSDSALRDSADAVVVGVVENVSTADEHIADGNANRNYRLRIRVETAEKGKPAATITARGWVVLSRPRGWVGPAGISELWKITAGQRVRAYLKTRSGSDYDLLEPNGIEVLAVRPAH